MRHHYWIYLAALLILPGAVRAGDVTFTQGFIANFEFDVLGGTPINPGPDTGYLPYEAVGALTFTLDAAINDPTQTTVAIKDATGVFNGVLPTGLLPYTISPDVQFLGGELTNIVRDAGGSITSADVSNLSMRWDLIAAGGALTLFTKDGLPFDGVISSIPLKNGDILSGPNVFDVYMNDGSQDILVAYGRDRTLTAVPEPGTVFLLLPPILVLAIVSRRRWAGTVVRAA